MTGIKKYRPGLLVFIFCYALPAAGQDINLLVQHVKDRLEKVNDYEATGKMKTNIVFLKVPVASVRVFYKKPGKLKIRNERGFSFIPKGAVNINMNNILSSGKYSVLDAGTDRIGKTEVKVVKLLPEDNNADVVLSTLYIDAVNEVILKSKTTTRDNGSYELDLSYGRYTAFGLPDKIIFSFNTKEYKLPKGVTFDFDGGTENNKTADKVKIKKGKAEILLSNYSINRGVADAVFQ